jgi:D-tyrosyl-tRNA(Tyr) deacylase
VTQAEVAVDGAVIGRTGPGLLILVCAMQGDTEPEAEKLAAKISKLRIFRDEAGLMNRSIVDTGGGALVVSQFTLAADTRRGNRPGFSTAAAPADGERLYLHFAGALAALGPKVETGSFGAEMAVSLTNDGPVTIWLDTEA